MPFVGIGAYIISTTGKTADVNSYNPQNGTLQIPIVDAAVQYDDPYSGTSYTLIIRNALHVPNMKNHLIPPFIMREAGIEVNDTPKVQMDDPNVEDHFLYFKEGELRIPLSLNGIFSYFETTKPTAQFLNDCEDVFLLTLCRWNPHDTAYQQNEE